MRLLIASKYFSFLSLTVLFEVHTMLFFRIVVLFSLMVMCQCRQSVDIAGPSTDDGFSKCNSGGERDETYMYSTGTLGEYNLKYEELDQLTSVIIHFRNIQLETKAVKNAGELLYNCFEQFTR